MQHEMFPVAHPTPKEIIGAALAYNPVARFAMFSGGDGSLEATVAAHGIIPDLEVLHIVTGIGLKITREFVRDTCATQGWKLTEILAKEDCGQDYREIVKKHGFPGPASHRYMYIQLKERCVEEVVRRRKTKRTDKVLLSTGIRHDDSQRRTGYGGKEINHVGAQMWVNPFYWTPSPDMAAWTARTGIQRNPASVVIGMSCECLCGSFASPGEKAMIRLVEPEFVDGVLEPIEAEVLAAGHCWGWEEKPPKQRDDQDTPDFFSPMCTNCLKSQRLAA